jgi:hypothetical protein
MFLAGPKSFQENLSHMIRLTVIGEQGRVAIVMSAPHFRITGGAVWIGPSAGGQKPLARYVSGRWQYGDTLWEGVRFEGPCRIVFGLAREPSGVSEEVSALSIVGDTLSANGIPFAVYDTARDMWHGVGANAWWHAFRVEGSARHGPSGPTDQSNPLGVPSTGGGPVAGLPAH